MEARYQTNQFFIKLLPQNIEVYHFFSIQTKMVHLLDNLLNPSEKIALYHKRGKKNRLDLKCNVTYNLVNRSQNMELFQVI